MSLAKFLGIEQEPKVYNTRSSKDRKALKRLMINEMIKYLNINYTRKGLKKEYKKPGEFTSPSDFFWKHINRFMIYGQIKNHYDFGGFGNFEEIYFRLFFKKSVLNSLDRILR